MARDIIINGESLVRVRFSEHVRTNGSLLQTDPAFPGTLIYDLGLALGGVRVSPKLVHQDVHADDFGPEVPVEVMANLAEASIAMTLVQWDESVARVCIAEAKGGVGVAGVGIGEGILTGCGIPLGGGQLAGATGNHYVGLNVLSEQLNLPWRFPTAYLVGNVEIPLGTKRTLLRLTWRAIPYVTWNRSVPLPYEYLVSNQAVVWDHGKYEQLPLPA